MKKARVNVSAFKMLSNIVTDDRGEDIDAESLFSEEQIIEQMQIKFANGDIQGTPFYLEKEIETDNLKKTLIVTLNFGQRSGLYSDSPLADGWSTFLYFESY